jgi:hypothetical protein
MNSNLSPEEMNLLTMQARFLRRSWRLPYEQDFLCRIFGKCLPGICWTARLAAIGQVFSVSKLFTYARYNAELSSEGLTAALNTSTEDVQQIDSWIISVDARGWPNVGSKSEKEHFAAFPPAS